MGPRLSQGVWEAGRWIANLVGIGLAVDFLNFSLPDVPRSWHWLTPGTGFVVLTLVGSSRAVRSLCPAFFFLSEDLSGRLAASVILMLWIYMASLIVLVGAVADYEIERAGRAAGAA